MSRTPYMELGIALGEINSTISELELTRDSIQSRINSMTRRAEAIKEEMRVTPRVSELETANAFLRSTLHRCIAHAGLPDPATGCRAIIATAKDALAIP